MTGGSRRRGAREPSQKVNETPKTSATAEWLWGSGDQAKEKWELHQLCPSPPAILHPNPHPACRKLTGLLFCVVSSLGNLHWVWQQKITTVYSKLRGLQKGKTVYFFLRVCVCVFVCVCVVVRFVARTAKRQFVTIRTVEPPRCIFRSCTFLSSFHTRLALSLSPHT